MIWAAIRSVLNYGSSDSVVLRNATLYAVCTSTSLEEWAQEVLSSHSCLTVSILRQVETHDSPTVHSVLCFNPLLPAATQNHFFTR